MKYALQLKNIRKTYPGVVALSNVSLDVLPGEVHAIIGENGAGKSTLIKVIAGAIKPDRGEIVISDQVYKEMTPAKSAQLGIGVIYQEFNLVDSMNVAENVFLGGRKKHQIFQDKKMIHRRTAEFLEEFDIDIDTHAEIRLLSTAKQQMVEIVKALSKDVKILIMDEPSAAISVAEVEKLFRIIRKLKEKGVAIIYISHRMDEIFDIADRVTVLRDGQYINTEQVGSVSRRELINMMVGRPFEETFPTRNSKIGDVVLELRNVNGNGDNNLNLKLHKGEILGIAGLIGAGRTEMAKLIFGDCKLDSGSILIKGKNVKLSTTKDAIDHGIGLIPEDRRHEGAFQAYSIEWNMQVMALRRLSKLGFVDRAALDKIVKDYMERLRVVAPSAKQLVRNLSGGNQQKVVLAKVLASNADILIFDEPTRGIDVAAKQEIYHLMNDLVERGMSIIMITSEMEELLGMSDRIIVMLEGRMTGELQKDEFSQSNVMMLATN